MANQRLTSLTTLTSPASGDVFYIVDISDTADGASGTSKGITYANFIAGITELTGLTTPITVVQGGTGAATLTGILKGNGTSAFTAVTAPSGDIVGTTDTQVLTNKVFTLPQINDTSSDHQYVFAVSELAADRTVTLPLLTTSDEFVFKAHAQTFTNKSIDGDTNTLTNLPVTSLKIASEAQGDVIYRSASGWTRLGAGTSGYFLKTQGAGADPTWAASSGGGSSGIYQQALINGGFDVWQRNTTFTYNDDTFGPDRWNLLTETNGAWTCVRDTDVPAALGFKYSAKFSNVTLNNQAAIVQILENIDSIKLDDQAVSLSFYAKTNSTEIANLRATVLSWSSTADSVTSDVIGTWASDGTDPTWAANWTSEVAGSNKALTSSWQRFTVENITIDTASMANIAVVIWVDDGTIAANDDFYITGIMLNQGATALTWMPLAFEEELAKSQRYYEKSYNQESFAGAATQVGEEVLYSLAADQTTRRTMGFAVTKRTTPTVTVYDPIGGGADAWYDVIAAGAKAATAEAVGARGFTSKPTTNLSAASFELFQWVAVAEL